MNIENQSLVDMLFSWWKAMSPAGKVLAGGVALIWLIWLFWLPIAQESSTQTFLPTISDSEAQPAENMLETDEEVFLPAIAGED